MRLGKAKSSRNAGAVERLHSLSAPPKKRRAPRGEIRPARNKRNKAKYWSAYVTKHSRALDMDEGVFTWNDPLQIAASLKRSALRSRRRKGDPYRSALSMLVFYMNRAGKNLPATRKRMLESAKI
jgi:hypothetical protein